MIKYEKRTKKILGLPMALKLSMELAIKHNSGLCINKIHTIPGCGTHARNISSCSSSYK